MNFEELLLKLQGQEQTVYSVENRNMLDHETDIAYYLTAEEAIAAAEAVWRQMDQILRADREISVHQGIIEQPEGQKRPRFLVHKKLFKAYKKLYVGEAYAKNYLKQRKAYHLANGAGDEQTASSLAKSDFNERFVLQGQVAYGMFAGYSYGPQDPDLF